MAFGVELQALRRVGFGVEAEEGEAHPCGRARRQMLLDPHHVGHDRRADVLAGRVAHRRDDRRSAERGERARSRRPGSSISTRDCRRDAPAARGCRHVVRTRACDDRRLRRRQPRPRARRTASETSWRASRAAKAEIVGGVVGLQARAHRIAHEGRIVGRVGDAGRGAAAEASGILAVGVARLAVVA